MRIAIVLVAASLAGASGCADTCSPIGNYHCDTLPAGTKVMTCDSSAHESVVKDCSAMGEQCTESSDESLQPSDPNFVGCAPSGCSNPCFVEGASWCLLDGIFTCVKTSATCMQAQSMTDCTMAGKKCVVANGVPTCM